MPDRIAVVLLLALAASLSIPAATATLPVDPVQPALEEHSLLEPLPPLPNGEVLGDGLSAATGAEVVGGLSASSGPAGIGVQATAKASIEVAPTPSQEPAATADPSALAPQSFGASLGEIAAPAAGSALVALGVIALAIGAEGLRVLQTRAADLVSRFGRTLGGLVAFPLFSRIESAGLLENPVRARVHDIVVQEPGLSLTEVTARAGIAWGTAVHHLRRLERHGLVVSISQRGHRRFFVANTPAASQRTAMAVVMHPTARRIAQLVSQRPGIDQSGICQTLGLNNPAASKHLNQFEQQGLVLSQRSGRSRLYHPTGGLQSALLLLEPTITAVPASSSPLMRPTAAVSC